jgi:hypothetical protein
MRRSERVGASCESAISSRVNLTASGCFTLEYSDSQYSTQFRPVRKSFGIQTLPDRKYS